MSKTPSGGTPIVCGLVLLILIVSCSPLPAARGAPPAPPRPGDYYVDALTGSNLNPGTASAPWRTIQKAADTVVSGSTVHVRPGRYQERVRVTRPGRAGAPIVFQARGIVRVRGFTILADDIAVRGFEITGTPDLWDDGVGIFVDARRCLLEDNEIRYATRGGILLFCETCEPGSANCVVRNNRLVRNALIGIEIHGNDHVIEGNEIWGTVQYHPGWADPPTWVDADGIRFFGQGHRVTGNYIHDISYDHPQNVNPHIDCFQTWGPAVDIVFERNRCEVLEYQGPDEQGKGFMIESRAGLVRDIVIRNNVILAFNHVTILDGRRIHIVNNTFVSDLKFDVPAQVGIGLFRALRITVKNNIFYDVARPHLAPDAVSERSLEAGNNNVFRTDGVRPRGTPSRGDLWGLDPLFVNRAAGDFRLQLISPGIDAGAQVDVTTDFTGGPRPLGGGHDIGAYESVIHLVARPGAIGNVFLEMVPHGLSPRFPEPP
ncbi:MAG TPA: right-handed parallel beta-helix repeat-containing protein [Anaerolineae bacterium]|nr:right-handed parallel beta-helix repeat-containing protein [Anaerolineae bacterium]